MRLPSVPGPRDVLSLLERSGDALEQLLAAAPRIGGLLDQATRALGDVGGLLARIEDTREAADTLVDRAGALVDRAGAPIDRIAVLLDALEPSLTGLQPTLERLAETTDPREVDALVGLVDQLPQLLLQLERDVLPVMTTLGTVAPDLRDLLNVSTELNEMLSKLPGMGRIRKRVDEELAADDEWADLDLQPPGMV